MNALNSIASNPEVPFHLAAAGELKPAVTLGQGLPPKVNGLPAFYYWKDAIVVGSYVHPAGKFSLQITRERLDGYASTFEKMKSNGVAVPILMDHAESAAATLGWIIDVKRKDDQLMELHQFLGESARDIGLRNKVSLGINPNFVDGKGNRYGEAIVHSAVTPVPVVPNQGDFEPLEQIVTLSLAVAESRTSSLLSAGVPAEACPELVEWVEASNQAVIEPSQIHRSPRAQDMPNAPLTELAMSAISDAAQAKRDLAVSRGGVDPAVADELFSLLVHGKGITPDALLLSRNGNTAPIALAVFDALSRNRPVPLGEVTRLQVLSRSVPGLDPELASLQEKMIALASGAPAKTQP